MSRSRRACELLAFGSWGLNLSYQAWWQALLPLEPSLWSCGWLYVGPRDLNRGPLACTTSALTHQGICQTLGCFSTQESRCCWGLLLHSSSIRSLWENSGSSSGASDTWINYWNQNHFCACAHTQNSVSCLFCKVMFWSHALSFLISFKSKTCVSVSTQHFTQLSFELTHKEAATALSSYSLPSPALVWVSFSSLPSWASFSMQFTMYFNKC